MINKSDGQLVCLKNQLGRANRRMLQFCLQNALSCSLHIHSGLHRPDIVLVHTLSRHLVQESYCTAQLCIACMNRCAPSLQCTALLHMPSSHSNCWKQPLMGSCKTQRHNLCSWQIPRVCVGSRFTWPASAESVCFTSLLLFPGGHFHRLVRTGHLPISPCWTRAAVAIDCECTLFTGLRAEAFVRECTPHPTSYSYSTRGVLVVVVASCRVGWRRLDVGLCP